MMNEWLFVLVVIDFSTIPIAGQWFTSCYVASAMDLSEASLGL